MDSFAQDQASSGLSDDCGVKQPAAYVEGQPMAVSGTIARDLPGATIHLKNGQVNDDVSHRISRLFLPSAFLALPGAAVAQEMLEPPATKYFLSKGAWGQDYPDQWALSHIGFDNSPDFGLASGQTQRPAGDSGHHRYRARLETIATSTGRTSGATRRRRRLPGPIPARTDMSRTRSAGIFFDPRQTRPWDFRRPRHHGGRHHCRQLEGQGRYPPASTPSRG